MPAGGGRWPWGNKITQGWPPAALARPEGRQQIARVLSHPGTPRAPYALAPTVFPFPALAALAGRASLGGPREVALACLVVGRLVVEAGDVDGLTSDQRRVRAQRTRQWLSAAAIPQPVRGSLVRLVETTAGGDRAATRAALDAVMTVTASHLDQAARLELERLAQAIAG